MINELIQSVRRLFTFAVLSRDSIKSGVKYLQVKLGNDFPLDDIEHVEHFGFTSRALGGADLVLLSQGGNRGKTICLMAADRQYRIDIDTGETAIYNQYGDKVHLRTDRTIEIKTPVRVLLDTDLVECTNDFRVRGDAQVDGQTVLVGDTTMAANAEVANNLNAGSATINGREFIDHTHDEHDGNTTNGVN